MSDCALWHEYYYCEPGGCIVGQNLAKINSWHWHALENEIVHFSMMQIYHLSYGVVYVMSQITCHAVFLLALEHSSVIWPSGKIS